MASDWEYDASTGRIEMTHHVKVKLADAKIRHYSGNKDWYYNPLTDTVEMSHRAEVRLAEAKRKGYGLEDLTERVDKRALIPSINEENSLEKLANDMENILKNATIVKLKI